jgi:lipopolysaccharide transport system ATP-binding protein
MSALIQATDLTVDFPIYEANARSFKSAVLRTATGGVLSRESGRVTIRALDRLNFEMKEGDRIGLVGHNGSGKSTLLRVIAGVYEPTGGAISVDGKIASMLNIWLGMNMDASGVENIYLRARVLGMSIPEIDRVVDEICEFAELGDFIHMPLRTYSSGMQMRLAFAVSTSVAADIVLMDEWLSVGDADFAAKAQERLKQMLGRTKIMIVASHNEDMVRKSCNKILRLEHGKIAEFRDL